MKCVYAGWLHKVVATEMTRDWNRYVGARCDFVPVFDCEHLLIFDVDRYHDSATDTPWNSYISGIISASSSLYFILDHSSILMLFILDSYSIFACSQRSAKQSREGGSITWLYRCSQSLLLITSLALFESHCTPMNISMTQ
jgi:hypothetical protein